MDVLGENKMTDAAQGLRRVNAYDNNFSERREMKLGRYFAAREQSVSSTRGRLIHQRRVRADGVLIVRRHAWDGGRPPSCPRPAFDASMMRIQPPVLPNVTGVITRWKISLHQSAETDK